MFVQTSELLMFYVFSLLFYSDCMLPMIMMLVTCLFFLFCFSFVSVMFWLSNAIVLRWLKRHCRLVSTVFYKVQFVSFNAYSYFGEHCITLQFNILSFGFYSRVLFHFGYYSRVDDLANSRNCFKLITKAYEICLGEDECHWLAIS